MLHKNHVSRYSSIVTLRLLAHGQVYPLAQVSSEFVILKSTTPIPAGPAIVVVTVDGDERRWNVTLSESDGTNDIIPTRPA